MRQILDARLTARPPLHKGQYWSDTRGHLSLCLVIPNRFLQAQENHTPGLRARILGCACLFLLKAILYHIERFDSMILGVIGARQGATRLEGR